jgi:hypothetical protein
MELKASFQHYFQTYIIHCHRPTGFAVGEAKEGPCQGTLVEKRHFNIWNFSKFSIGFQTFP